MEMTWEKGVLYKISPKKKKSIVDIQFYSMDGDSFIKYTEAYRGGYVTVLGDEMLEGNSTAVYAIEARAEQS
jgi:hypothetical protein